MFPVPVSSQYPAALLPPRAGVEKPKKNARFKWRRRCKSPVAKFGRPVAVAFPAMASSKFGNGKLGQVFCAAGVPVAIAVRREMFCDFLVGAEIPALLREGALEAMDGGLDVSRKCLHLAKWGTDAPLRSNAPGCYVLNVATFDDGLDLGRRRLPSLTEARLSLETPAPQKS